jgi:hypothetical protein
LNIIIQTSDVATGVATIGSRKVVRAHREPRKSRFRTIAIAIPRAVDTTTDNEVKPTERVTAAQNCSLLRTLT